MLNKQYVLQFGDKHVISNSNHAPFTLEVVFAQVVTAQTETAPYS